MRIGCVACACSERRRNEDCGLDLVRRFDELVCGDCGLRISGSLCVLFSVLNLVAAPRKPELHLAHAQSAALRPAGRGPGIRIFSYVSALSARLAVKRSFSRLRSNFCMPFFLRLRMSSLICVGILRNCERPHEPKAMSARKGTTFNPKADELADERALAAMRRAGREARLGARSSESVLGCSEVAFCLARGGGVRQRVTHVLATLRSGLVRCIDLEVGQRWSQPARRAIYLSPAYAADEQLPKAAASKRSLNCL